jgi:hypothetical protein
MHAQLQRSFSAKRPPRKLPNIVVCSIAPGTPQGQTSVKWTPGRDVSGDPVVRIRFDTVTCRACPARQACTWAQNAPRQLTVRPQAQ